MPTLHLRLSSGTQQTATSSTHNIELRREIPAQNLTLSRVDLTLWMDPTAAGPNPASALPGISLDLGERMFQGVEVETNVRGLGDCIIVPIEAEKVFYDVAAGGGVPQPVTVSVPVNYTFNANELRKSFPITVRSWDNSDPRVMVAYPGTVGPPATPTETLLFVDLHFDFSVLTDPNIY